MRRRLFNHPSMRCSNCAGVEMQAGITPTAEQSSQPLPVYCAVQPAGRAGWRGGPIRSQSSARGGAGRAGGFTVSANESPFKNIPP